MSLNFHNRKHGALLLLGEDYHPNWLNGEKNTKECMRLFINLEKCTYVKYSLHIIYNAMFGLQCLVKIYIYMYDY